MSDCDSCWYANKGWDYCPIHYPGKQIEDCPAYCRDDVCTVEEEIRQEDSQMYSNDIIFALTVDVLTMIIKLSANGVEKNYDI